MDELTLARKVSDHAVWWADHKRGECADFYREDLEGQDLSGVSLPCARFCCAYLTDAKLADAQVAGADFTGADLFGANLHGAKLAGAGFLAACLVEADLSEADLTGAGFRGAYLLRANLEGAMINWISHELIAELLARAAGQDRELREVAAVVAFERRSGWCWDDFLALDDPRKDWALGELVKWVQPGDNAPRALREYAAKEQE